MSKKTKLRKLLQALTQETVNGEANPETKGAYAKRILIVHLKERILNQKKDEVLASASVTEPTIT